MTQPDKKRPVAERIAGLDIKSSYRDVRDGIGGGRSVMSLSDQDLAAALGFVRLGVGNLPVLALETYYGSSLRHEQALRTKWLDHRENFGDAKEERIRVRLVTSIAIRQFAGIVHPTSFLAEYGFFLLLKPNELQNRMNEVLAWLEALRDEGLQELRKTLAESRAPLDNGKMNPQNRQSQNYPPLIPQPR